jgi:hypothetical protein
LTSSAIADLKIRIAGSFELAGKLLLKLSADLAFQNFFSNSSIELFIFLNNLNYQKLVPMKKLNMLLIR